MMARRVNVVSVHEAYARLESEDGLVMQEQF
jgi:hypothetical protein